MSDMDQLVPGTYRVGDRDVYLTPYYLSVRPAEDRAARPCPDTADGHELTAIVRAVVDAVVSETRPWRPLANGACDPDGPPALAGQVLPWEPVPDPVRLAGVLVTRESIVEQIGEHSTCDDTTVGLAAVPVHSLDGPVHALLAIFAATKTEPERRILVMPFRVRGGDRG